jgi:hypothetical protein
MIKQEELVPMDIESSFVVCIFVEFYAHWPAVLLVADRGCCTMRGTC